MRIESDSVILDTSFVHINKKMALRFTYITIFVTWTLVFAAATKAATADDEDSIDREECFGTKCETGCCPWEDWFCCDGEARG